MRTWQRQPRLDPRERLGCKLCRLTNKLYFLVFYDVCAWHISCVTCVFQVQTWPLELRRLSVWKRVSSSGVSFDFLTSHELKHTRQHEYPLNSPVTWGLIQAAGDCSLTYVSQFNIKGESLFLISHMDPPFLSPCSRGAGPVSGWSPQQWGRTGSGQAVWETGSALRPSVCQSQQSGLPPGPHQVRIQLWVCVCVCGHVSVWDFLFFGARCFQNRHHLQFKRASPSVMRFVLTHNAWIGIKVNQDMSEVWLPSWTCHFRHFLKLLAFSPCKKYVNTWAAFFPQVN